MMDRTKSHPSSSSSCLAGLSAKPHGIVNSKVNVRSCRSLRACRAYGYRGPAKLAFKAPLIVREVLRLWNICMLARPWTRTGVAHYAQMTLPSLTSGPAGMASRPAPGLRGLCKTRPCPGLGRQQKRQSLRSRTPRNDRHMAQVCARFLTPEARGA